MDENENKVLEDFAIIKVYSYFINIEIDELPDDIFFIIK